MCRPYPGGQDACRGGRARLPAGPLQRRGSSSAFPLLPVRCSSCRSQLAVAMRWEQCSSTKAKSMCGTACGRAAFCAQQNGGLGDIGGRLQALPDQSANCSSCPECMTEPACRPARRPQTAAGFSGARPAGGVWQPSAPVHRSRQGSWPQQRARRAGRAGRRSTVHLLGLAHLPTTISSQPGGAGQGCGAAIPFHGCSRALG